MRHKWKKNGYDEIIFHEEIEEEEHHLLRTHFALKEMECIYCGLKKGWSKSMSGWYPKLVYYRKMPDIQVDGESANILLSVDKIPYECIPELKEINRDLNTDFLSVEDVEVV